MPNATTSLFTKSAAVLSPCGRYRYTLSRTWDESLPVVCFCMLNPSTADAEQDDPTIRRILGFSQHWGYGGIVVANLFALRATDPQELVAAKDPVGPDNDGHIVHETYGRVTVCAWGNHGGFLGRDRRVMRLLGTLHQRPVCLGLTRAGHPRHPLYVAGDTEPVPYEPRQP